MQLSTLLRLTVPVLIFAMALSAVLFLPVREYLRQAVHWVETLGFWGPLLLLPLYLVTSLFLLPSSVLTVAAGLVFGILWGTGAALLGVTLGALGPFYVGRTLLRSWIEKRIKGHPRFQAVDRVVEDEGFKMVFLIRISPLFPYNITNYVFAVTRVSLKDFLLGTFFGMFPGTLLYVYLGSAARTLLDLAEGKTQEGIWGQVFFGIGLVAALGVTVFTTWYAKKELDEEMASRPHAR